MRTALIAIAAVLLASPAIAGCVTTYRDSNWPLRGSTTISDCDRYRVYRSDGMMVRWNKRESSSRRAFREFVCDPFWVGARHACRAAR